jgi:hypothetical protein
MSSSAGSKMARHTLRSLSEVHNDMDENNSHDEAINPPVVAAKRKTRRRKFDVLMEKRPRAGLAELESRKPKYEARVQALLARGKNITGEHLGNLGKALLERNLIHPPKDHRVRIQIARTALEAGSVIGAGATELHLHASLPGLPPVVQKMLLEKMAELASLKSRPELSAPVIDVPPEPIQGEEKD